MTSGMSKFLLGLRPIERYHLSGRPPWEVQMSLSAQSFAGGSLTMQGRQYGVFHQVSEGTLTTPFGQVSFRGTRGFLYRGEQVSLTSGEGEGAAWGRLRFPVFWGILSCSNRARLWLSSDPDQPLEIRKPSVQFEETVGRFKLRQGEPMTYRLFSQNDDDRVFEDGYAFEHLKDSDALLIVASLFYLCFDHGLVLDGG